MKKRQNKYVYLVFAVILATVMVFAATGCSAAQQPTPTDDAVYYSVAVDGGSGAGKYRDGFICTVKAEVPEGKQFLKWIKNGKEASINAEYAFNVREDTRLIAVFGDMPENAGSEVCVIKTLNGIGSGGYIKGGKCTVTTLASDEGRTFVGWFEAQDGEATGEAVSVQKQYTFDVTKDVTLTAKYSDFLLRTPDNSENRMFNLIAGEGHIDFDNQIDPETGETFTAFTEGVAYILLWVYTSNADDALPIGSFKMVSGVNGSGVNYGYICTMNYDEQAGTGSRIDFQGEPGAYYTPDGNTHNMLKAGITEYMGGYSTAVTYYFATQAIGIEVEDGEMIYLDSPISAKGRGVLNM